MIRLGISTSPDLVRDVRGVIFDCDGVMVDSFQANVVFYNSFKKRFGLPPMTKEEEEYTHAQNVTRSLAHILPPERLEEALEQNRRFDYRELLPHIRIEPGLISFVSLLRAHGVPMAVNTNRTNTMELLLSHLGLYGFFTPVMTAAKVSRTKPHPESMHYIVASWNIKPHQAAYIGDTPLDQQAAHRAGVRFWAYKNPRLEAEMLIEDFMDIRRLFAQVLRDK
jgi:HAD superfamily hydrolase (TIGR01509 family)